MVGRIPKVRPTGDSQALHRFGFRESRMKSRQ
jgi:hypothetical protein